MMLMSLYGSRDISPVFPGVFGVQYAQKPRFRNAAKFTFLQKPNHADDGACSSAFCLLLEDFFRGWVYSAFCPSVPSNQRISLRARPNSTLEPFLPLTSIKRFSKRESIEVELRNRCVLREEYLAAVKQNTLTSRLAALHEFRESLWKKSPEVLQSCPQEVI